MQMAAPIRLPEAKPKPPAKHPRPPKALQRPERIEIPVRKETRVSAEIRVSHDGGKWHWSYEVNGATFGNSSPSRNDAGHATKEEAIAAGCAKIAEILRSKTDPATRKRAAAAIYDVESFAARVLGAKVQEPRKVAKPVPAKQNKFGVVERPTTIRVPLPKSYRAEAKVSVAYLPGGWRAQFDTHCGGIGNFMGQSGPVSATCTAFASEVEAVTDCLERLADLYDHCASHGSKTETKRGQAIAREVRIFSAGWARRVGTKTQDPKPKTTPGTALVPAVKSAPPGVIRERRKLLEDFRRSYETFERSWLDLGEKAIGCRDVLQVAREHGEPEKTFDEWIAAEKFDRSVVYGCMKGARIHSLMAPAADRAKIVLDRESHFRAFPADVDAKDAAAIVKRLAKSVQADEDGLKRPTAKQVKEAVEAEFTNPDDRRLRDEARADRRAEAKHHGATEGTEPESRPGGLGMFANGSQPSGVARFAPDILDAASQAVAELPDAPFFPRVETIGQACCYLRSWVLAMARQFPAEELSDLDEEMYAACITLRKMCRPTLAEVSAPAAARRKAR